MSARRRKFYGWGYADDGATPEEIKRALDPRGMFNPGVPIDPEP